MLVCLSLNGMDGAGTGVSILGEASGGGGFDPVDSASVDEADAPGYSECVCGAPGLTRV